MDWDFVVERNRKGLMQVLAMLVAMAGLAGPGLPFSPDGRRWPVPAGAASGGFPGAGPGPLPAAGGGEAAFPAPPAERLTLSRRMHRAVMRLLRPAEAAVRRLVIVAARGIVVPPPRLPPLRPASVPAQPSGGRLGPVPASRPARRPPAAIALPLLDPPRRIARRRWTGPRSVPRIAVPGVTPLFALPPRRKPPMSFDRMDVARLALRLDALGRVLDDLPRQALRFARWRARNEAFAARERETGEPSRRVSKGRYRYRRPWPLRTGRAPGSVRRPTHEVHTLLADLHGLAFDVLQRPDTS